MVAKAFRKLESGAKKFFGKIESGAKNFFKKGGQLDTGLRKVGNTIGGGAGILGSIGKVARGLAPVAGAILGPEAGVALYGADKALQKAKKLGQAGAGVAREARGAVRSNEGNLGGAITGIGEAVRKGIEAKKPAPDMGMAPEEDMIGLAGMPNFA